MKIVTSCYSVINCEKDSTGVVRGSSASGEKFYIDRIWENFTYVVEWYINAHGTFYIVAMRMVNGEANCV